MDKTFDPEKYEMTFCPLCQGDGKLVKTPEGFEVCKECGSFGLIKKEWVTLYRHGELRKENWYGPGERQTKIFRHST